MFPCKLLLTVDMSVPSITYLNLAVCVCVLKHLLAAYLLYFYVLGYDSFRL